MLSGDAVSGRYHAADFEPKIEWIQREVPQHRVTITQPFLMGKSAVTLRAFRNFVTESGYVTEPERDGEGGWGYDPDAEGNKLVGREARFTWRNTGWDQSEDHPVVNVTWNDACAYIEFINQQAIPTDKQLKVFRLASEAEWEYGCRAGTGAFYYNGNDPEEFHEIGNCVDGTWNEKWPTKLAIRGKSGFLFSAPVCQFRPNAFGLYDMLGNVFEWCQDWYGTYGSGAADDPTGPSSGSSRVLRGGSWFHYAVSCRSAFRYGSGPSGRRYVGFRLLCELR